MLSLVFKFFFFCECSHAYITMEYYDIFTFPDNFFQLFLNIVARSYVKRQMSPPE